jgi:hypothetical protein
MPRPGVEVFSLAEPTARSAPTDTGVWFVVGLTASLPVDGSGNPVPKLIHSMNEYEAVFGVRGSGVAQDLYDAVQTYYREGGSQVYVSPLPAAATGTPTEYEAALDRLTADLGPGQVSAPGSVDAAVQGSLVAHAEATNRVALLDAPSTGVAQDFIDAGEALQSAGNGRYGAAFGPGAVIPGVASGTTRSVSWAAIVAGIIARNDVPFTPNQAAAGVNGISLYALDVSARFTDLEYEAINAAGVNMARNRYGTLEMYGFRSLVDPVAHPEWLNFGNARLNMAIVAQATAIAERYVFSQIDGRKRMIGDFGGELAAMLVPFYEAGALYGATADDAFRVNVGSQVNTPATIANGELHAVIEVRMSPFAELVVIEIVKVSTVEAAAAPPSLSTLAA